MNKFFLIQKPSTMEDEGRYNIIGRYNTEVEADDARRHRVEISKGYYSYGSMLVAKECDVFKAIV